MRAFILNRYCNIKIYMVLYVNELPTWRFSPLPVMEVRPMVTWSELFALLTLITGIVAVCLKTRK